MTEQGKGPKIGQSYELPSARELKNMSASLYKNFRSLDFHDNFSKHVDSHLTILWQSNTYIL